MSYFHKFVEFSKAIFSIKYLPCIAKNISVLPKIFALTPTNRRFAEKNWLSGKTAVQLARQNVMIGLISYIRDVHFKIIIYSRIIPNL